MERERLPILVSDSSGRMDPATLAAMHAAIIEADLQVMVGQPNTEDKQAELAKRLNDSLQYPTPLYQNREERRKAEREAKRKKRRMY